MTIHLLLIFSAGTLISTTAINGAMQCGQTMPAVIAALEPVYGPIDAYCKNTGAPDTRPEARP
jgi:hypothetical protein